MLDAVTLSLYTYPSLPAAILLCLPITPTHKSMLMFFFNKPQTFHTNSY